MRLHFSVRDTGIRIPRKKQKAIFEAFAQGDASTTRRFGGTGLGLTIPSRLSELMRGQIWLESEPGKGSVFHFTVRLASLIAADQGPPNSRRRRSSCLPGVPVLVVDDNLNQSALNPGWDVLWFWHMHPAAAASGEEALFFAIAPGVRSEEIRFALVLS